jgi:hypothetical protein
MFVDRLQLLRQYMNDRFTALSPGAVGMLHKPGEWLNDSLDLTALPDERPGKQSTLSAEPTATIVEPPSDPNSALWLDPNYHHKGFLPMHDAMMLGVNVRQQLGDSGVGISAHPFYGQNWHSIDGYGGVETALSFRNEASVQPWGKIAIGFTSGDHQMMDHNTGIDLHGELDFTDNLSLNAGIRNDDYGNGDNYVMLRWKLIDGF